MVAHFAGQEVSLAVLEVTRASRKVVCSVVKAKENNDLRHLEVGSEGSLRVFNIMSLLMADKSSLAVDPQAGWVFDYWHCAADRAFRRFCWHQQHADQWPAPHFQRLAAAH